MTASETRLREILCDILEIEPEDLTEDASFADDYDADSLRAVEILAALEKDFGIIIPEDELVNMADLASVKEVMVRCGWQA